MQRLEAVKMLEDVRKMDNLIKCLKVQLSMEWDAMTSSSAHLKDIVVKSGNKKNVIEEKMPEYIDLKEKITTQIRKLAEHKMKVLGIIERIDDYRLQQLLITRYLQGHTLEETAEIMDKSYTWTWDTLQVAIDKFTEILEENSESV